jgi:hypothetical protein
MTRKDIKQAKQDGYSDWEILHQVVASGVEFPDASYLVSQALNMNSEQREQMERDYDECA